MSIFEMNVLRANYETGKENDRLKAELLRAQRCIRGLRARVVAHTHDRHEMLLAMHERYARLQTLPHKYGFRLAMMQVGLSMPNVPNEARSKTEG